MCTTILDVRTRPHPTGSPRNLATHPEQGWTLLCNGAIVFDDLGALLPTTPTATSVQPPRPSRRLRAVRAFPARPAVTVPARSVLPAAA
jgi:hypothetical protein